MPTHPPTGWTFALPDDQIARRPTSVRSGSRLLCLGRVTGSPAHNQFVDLPTHLSPGDLLVVNDVTVMAARLRAKRASGGAVELLVLDPGPGAVRALARPAKKLRAGDVLTLSDGSRATIVAPAQQGVVSLRTDDPIAEVMRRSGELPLPPYMDRPAEPSDTDRYQTVFGGPLGAAAAPTAGLHFDAPLLQHLGSAGVRLARLTLYVGLGTFLPLRPEQIAAGRLHVERYDIPGATVEAIAQTRAGGGRVVAVGTTSARALEAATLTAGGLPTTGPGSTDLFIQPPYDFRAIDGLITNFHLPGSSLLMLVGALVGRSRLLAAYDCAVRTGYRFYSYGDAMLIL